MVRIVDALEYYDEDRGFIPDDITLMTAEDLRNAHSYWVSCHNHASGRLAAIKSRLKELKRLREIKYKQLYIMYKDKKQTNDMARYRAEMKPSVRELDDKINILEIHMEQWNSLVTQCESKKTLCSRDQSWRQEEFSAYYNRNADN